MYLILQDRKPLFNEVEVVEGMELDKSYITSCQDLGKYLFLILVLTMSLHDYSSFLICLVLASKAVKDLFANIKYWYTGYSFNYGPNYWKVAKYNFIVVYYLLVAWQQSSIDYETISHSTLHLFICYMLHKFIQCLIYSMDISRAKGI